MQAQLQGHWSKQRISCLLAAPEGDGIFFWQRCPKFMQILDRKCHPTMGLLNSMATSGEADRVQTVCIDV